MGMRRMVRAMSVGGVRVDLSAGRRRRVDFGVMIRGLWFNHKCPCLCCVTKGGRRELTTIVTFWPGLIKEDLLVSQLYDRS